MKRNVLFFLLAFLSFSPLSVHAEEEAPVPASPPILSEAASKIVPHKALYKVSLAKARHDSALHDVSGTMLFDMADACDGWTVHQHMQMQFSYEGAERDDVTSAIVTWESKDGKSFVFNIKRTVGGQLNEAYKGRASMASNGGVARYTYPRDKEPLTLPSGVMFPISHTTEILEKAKTGEKLFTKRVFDGSDEEGSAEVSAFIRGTINEIPEVAVPEEVRKNPLVMGQPAWPVRLAFYSPKAPTSEPDYEMDMVLQENGVARSMVIDYGEFSVSGTLIKIEPVESAGCTTPK